MKRAMVVAAAARTFGRLGYEAATLGDVASEAGLDRSTIYYYASSKEWLLRAVIRDAVTENVRIIRAISTSDLPPSQKLVEAICELMEAYDRHYPHLYVYARADVDTLARDGSPETAEILELASQYALYFTEILSEGKRAGVLHLDTEPGVASWSILGMVSWTYRWYKRGGTLKPSELGRSFANLVLNGLLDRADPDPIERAAAAGQWRDLNETSLKNKQSGGKP